VPSLKPAYLVHGDDHGAISERRASLKALGELHGGPGAVEILTGDAATPQGVALSLSAMTFALQTVQEGGVGRVIIVDGVERWKQAEVERDLAPALSPMPPDTTLALFAREDGRAKAPTALHKLVQAAAGQVIAHGNVKPWELPRWVRGEAKRLGLSLDAEAGKALVDQVGERQQRLLRELEKIALELRASPEQPVPVGVEELEARASSSAQRKVFTLADALVQGQRRRALSAYLELDAQGESLSGLLYMIASRLREAIAVCERLHAGEPASTVARSLRMPPKVAQRFVAQLEHAEEQDLMRGLGTLADLELDLRGGERVLPQRRPGAGLAEQTLAVLTVEAIAG
jgi:DNA polymerase III subunit delta